jgi:CDP-diacylglycerol--serine O-phosphatidyltransferase
MRKHIPNLITLLNLACGTTAVVLAMEGQWQWAVYLLLAASLMDFLDGMAARLLQAYSETGKQLDSLSDMVSFGVLPAVFIYNIFRTLDVSAWSPESFSLEGIILLTILLVPVCAAIRLARFNLQEDTAFFSGLPTPAHALFWTGIYWQVMAHGSLFSTEINPWFLWAIMLVMALHMIMPVPMYSLKFDHFRLRGNLVRYLLILLSVLMLVLTGLPGLTLAVLCYILLSLLNFLLQMRVSK